MLSIYYCLTFCLFTQYHLFHFLCITNLIIYFLFIPISFHTIRILELGLIPLIKIGFPFSLNQWPHLKWQERLSLNVKCSFKISKYFFLPHVILSNLRYFNNIVSTEQREILHNSVHTLWRNTPSLMWHGPTNITILPGDIFLLLSSEQHWCHGGHILLSYVRQFN